MNYQGNPVDQAKRIAAAKIPLLHIVSESDRVVPPQENTYLLKDRLEKLGTTLEVISVAKGTTQSNGHHFEHPAPQRVVDFILKHAIVLFMSDNGGLSAHGRGGKPHTHNKPLSSGKGSAHEGGVRVPMIVAWPGVTKPGSQCHRPVIIEDFFPTILQLAGIQHANQIGGVIDGKSFVPMLQGRTAAETEPRELIWHFPNNWGPKGPGIGPSSAIRRGDWKLIYYHADQSYELFNLARDLGERHNVADREPEVRKRLAQALRRRLQAVEAQMPFIRATGKRVPYPGVDSGPAS